MYGKSPADAWFPLVIRPLPDTPGGGGGINTISLHATSNSSFLKKIPDRRTCRSEGDDRDNQER